MILEIGVIVKDRGKEFEGIFSDAVEEIMVNGYQVDIQRLYDVIGKKTINQPADFMCYKKPNEIYVECKSTNKPYFSYYSQPQYPRLIDKSKIDGVKAGMLVWYVQSKRVFWFDIDFLTKYYASTSIKSLSIKKIDMLLQDKTTGLYEIEQVTIRVKPKMSIDKFFDYVSGVIK